MRDGALQQWKAFARTTRYHSPNHSQRRLPLLRGRRANPFLTLRIDNL